MPEEELPQAGVSVVEMFQKMREGEIRGLLSICNNVMVSLPDTNEVRRSLEGLDFYVCIDFFMSEGSRYADVVLPGSAWSEDEGVTATAKAAWSKSTRPTIRRAKRAPTGGSFRRSRVAWVAKSIFTFNSPREIFDELRVASRGGNADYYGITWEKIEKNNGIFWPCPTEDHPGTPRLFEERFYHPDGKAKFHAIEYNPPKEVPDEEFPLILTSGRVVYQYLSGNQTRRIGFLVQQCPEPYVEIHPETAMKLKINDGERVRVVSRRGEGVFPALVVRTIRPDTIFIPYHWGEELAVNQLTNPALDPTSKIPEFKACAARIEKIHSRTACRFWAQSKRKGASVCSESCRQRMKLMEETMFIDPQRCIGCRACVAACRECATHKGYSMIFVDYLDRAETTATMPTVCMHCNEPTCALVCPADAIKVIGRRRRAVSVEAALSRLPQLRQRLSVRRAEVQHADASADEMRHVLRPFVRRLKPMCASVCPTGAISFGKYEQIVPLRRTKPVNVHVFGNQSVETKVYLMLPTDADEVKVDGCGVFEGMLTRS